MYLCCIGVCGLAFPLVFSVLNAEELVCMRVCAHVHVSRVCIRVHAWVCICLHVCMRAQVCVHVLPAFDSTACQN